MESSVKRAIDLYQSDVRFRAIAQSIVARVMSDHGPVDPERADEDAFDIALKATALLLQRIYEEDPELAAMRADRDRYKALAENALHSMPMGPFIIKNPQGVPPQ